MTVLTFSDPAEMTRRSEMDSVKKSLDLIAKPVLAAADDSNAEKKKSCIRRPSASTMGKKRVRFARASTDGATERAPPSVRTTVLCLLKPSSEMTTDEKSSVWWDVNDVAFFRGTAALISDEIRRRSKAAGGEGPQAGGAPTYAQVVAHALEVCRRVQQEAAQGEGSALNLVECEERDPHPLPEMVSAYLAHWAKRGHSRRGLEKLSVEARAAAFRTHRQACVLAVLSAQARAAAREERRQGRSVSREEMTREASRRVTASARTYARAMGIADAAAVGYKHHEEEVGVTRRRSKCMEHVKVVSAAA